MVSSETGVVKNSRGPFLIAGGAFGGVGLNVDVGAHGILLLSRLRLARESGQEFFGKIEGSGVTWICLRLGYATSHSGGRQPRCKALEHG